MGTPPTPITPRFQFNRGVRGVTRRGDRVAVTTSGLGCGLGTTTSGPLVVTIAHPVIHRSLITIFINLVSLGALRGTVPPRGVSPTFWRNLGFRLPNSLKVKWLRQKGGSAKGLAEPPFWRILGGTLAKLLR